MVVKNFGRFQFKFHAARIIIIISQNKAAIKNNYAPWIARTWIYYFHHTECKVSYDLFPFRKRSYDEQGVCLMEISIRLRSNMCNTSYFNCHI